MATMTTTTGAVFIPEVWSRMVLEARESNLVLANLVTRLDKDVLNRGDIIHVPNLSNLVANDVTQGVDINLQAPTETEVTVNIDKFKESSFIINKLLKVQADYDLVSRYTSKVGYALAQQIDTDLATLASGFSQAFGTYNTAITTDVILDGIEALDLADVPMEDRHFVFRPDVKRDLLDLSTYTSKDFISGEPVSSGKIGDLYGVATHMSNNIVKTGNNTNNMLFQKEALALALQKAPNMEEEYSVLKKGHIVSGDAIYGVKELRDDHGILIRT